MVKALTNHISLLKVKAELANHSNRHSLKVPANHKPQHIARDQMVIKLTSRTSQHMQKEVKAIKPLNHTSQNNQRVVPANHSLQHRVKAVQANIRRVKIPVTLKRRQLLNNSRNLQKTLGLYRKSKCKTYLQMSFTRSSIESTIYQKYGLICSFICQ